jgi:hypothetical protein
MSSWLLLLSLKWFFDYFRKSLWWRDNLTPRLRLYFPIFFFLNLIWFFFFFFFFFFEIIFFDIFDFDLIYSKHSIKSVYLMQNFPFKVLFTIYKFIFIFLILSPSGGISCQIFTQTRNIKARDNSLIWYETKWFF